MHPDAIPLLRCPHTHTPLVLEDAAYRDGTIWSGVLRNRAGAPWFIRDGIADLMPRRAAWNGAQLVNRMAIAAWGYERLWRWRALSWLSGRSFPLNEELAAMIAQIGPRRGGAFLDLACSSGLYGRTLSRDLGPNGIVISLDHSEAMLREAQRRASSDHQGAMPRLSLVRGLAEELPLRDGALAGLVCGGSFNEFTNQDRVLSEARRVLAADGRSFWMQAQRAPTRPGRMLQRALGPGGVSFPSGDDLATAIQAAGLRIVFDQRDGAIQLIASRGRIIES